MQADGNRESIDCRRGHKIQFASATTKQHERRCNMEHEKRSLEELVKEVKALPPREQQLVKDILRVLINGLGTENQE